MGGSALLHTITFGAVIIMILLTAWIALMLESGHQPHEKHGLDKPSDHPDQEARQ